jgi:hypothetical protein
MTIGLHSSVQNMHNQTRERLIFLLVEISDYRVVLPFDVDANLRHRQGEIRIGIYMVQDHSTIIFNGNSNSIRAQQVRVTAPAPRQIWMDMLQADTIGLIDQSPDWFDTIQAYGPYKDASRLYEWENGQRAVLPAVSNRGLPEFLAVRSSPPRDWGIGGPVSERPLVEEEISTILADLSHLPGLRFSIRPNPLMGVQWDKAKSNGFFKIPRLAHAINLEGGFDPIWEKRFDENTRRNIHKAEKSGLVVQCDSSGKLVPVFYNLFIQSIDRWANRQHEPLFLARWRAARRDPIEKFQRMSQLLGNYLRIWVAWKEGIPVAALMVLQGRNAHYTRGAMNRDLAGPTRANDLLHKLAIEDACQSGCRYYQMGETGASKSLARFKSRFGADPYPYAEYVFERLPVTVIDHRLRSIVKKLIGFKDT